MTVHHKSPVVLGRRMRTRMRAYRVTVWALRFGGLSVSIAYDPKLSKSYHWQIDAWTRLAVLSGDERSVEAAEGKLTRLLSGVFFDLLGAVEKHNAKVLKRGRAA